MNNLEEDIKIIEYNMKCIRNVMNNFEDKLCENMQIKTDEVSKIIYNILSDYRRVLKENEKRMHDNITLKNFISALFNDSFEKDYISVQEIKDKIRKNEEIIDISNDGDLIHELLQKNKVYEELLESEE